MRFPSALTRMSAIAVVGFLATAATAFADPAELILTSKIVAVKDSKTAQKYVLRGNKARIYAKVSLHAKGPVGQGLRQWLEKRLPESLLGYFEREDSDTGLTLRYKPVPFRLAKRNIFCTAGTTADTEVCHADFAVSAANAVDVPGGEGGAHVVMLQMLPPANNLRLKMAKSEPYTYHVLSGDPKLSKYGFAGMSEGQ